MKLVNDSVTLGLGALGVAMFSLGFSVTGVACSAKPSGGATPEQTQLAAKAKAKPAVTLTMPELAVAPAVSAVPAAAPQPSAVKDTKSGLRIKRLVVTERIVAREPVTTESLSTARGPIYAFAELENASQEAQKIQITFEHEDTKTTVGHAELEIPANRPRFRTWGNTRNIREPGNWEAVVRTPDGKELARTKFEVESS